MSAPEITEPSRPRAQSMAAPARAFRDEAPAWRPPQGRAIRTWPLPALGLVDRWLTRLLMVLVRRQVAAVRGLEHLRAAGDPFIVAISHSTRREAIIVPAVLVMNRSGRLIHFLADWNFKLIPGVALLYRRGRVITVSRKPARPRFLNVLKPLYTSKAPPLQQARDHLLAGRAVGVFPEGTTNRHPRRLLRGRNGAARLSLETAAPVLPVGVRYPAADPARPLDDRDIMEINIGPLLRPPPIPGRVAGTAEVGAWHATVMNEIARLAGKSWPAHRQGSGDDEG